MTREGNELTETELLQRAQGGDNESVEILMQKYKGMVRKKARTLFMIGGDQDDLTQEGMIGLFKAIRDFNQEKETAFSTFAELCISRQLYSAIKSSNRMKNLPLNTYISIYSPAYTKGNGDDEGNFMVDQSMEALEMSPEDIIIDRETVDNLMEKIYKNLSNLEKQVFSFYMDGMTYQEIARRLGKSPKSIDNALQRIKTKVNCFLDS